MAAGENVPTISQPNTGNAGYAEWTQTINMKASQWYDVSGLASAQRCQIQVYIQWIDVNGTVGGAPTTGLFYRRNG
jgi:hypothetical protein